MKKSTVLAAVRDSRTEAAPFAVGRQNTVRHQRSHLTRKHLLAYCACVVDVFKALADPTRRTILDELTERNGQTLFEICARLATRHGLSSSRQAISQHLDILEAAGLVETRREGRYKFHDINLTPFEPIIERWLNKSNNDAGIRPGGDTTGKEARHENQPDERAR